MNTSRLLIAIAVGLGATLGMDVWNGFLKRVFRIPSLDYCLLGRWLLHMPAGTFRHASIGAAPKKRFECSIGPLAHYTIGIVLAVGFFVVASDGWLARPTAGPALLYGIATVVFPLFVMQPAFGLGFAASKTPRPTQARLKSLMTHTVFGVGLYVCAILLAPALGSAASAPGTLLAVAPADEPGQKLILEGQVVDDSGHPVAGAQLHITQTDASGRYTRERAMDESHARLSGSLRTDSHGRFELRTIRPGGYPNAVRIGDRDRKIPAHIHVDVTASGYVSRKTQVVFADDPLLADPYWQSWAQKAGHPIVSVSREGAEESARVVLTLRHVRSR
jgi:hypothetical protein